MPSTFCAQALGRGRFRARVLGKISNQWPLHKHKGWEGVPCRKVGSGGVAPVWSSPKWNEGVNQREPPGSEDT